VYIYGNSTFNKGDINMTAKKKTSTKKSKKEKPVLEYTDGKSCDTLSSRAKGLDEILSEQSSNPFRTEDSEEFQEKIEEMSLSQMQELAVRASIFPSGNKTTLKNKLCREFKAKFHTGLKIAQVTKPVFDLNSEAAKKALEISKLNS
jgi:hypothetical protein